MAELDIVTPKTGTLPFAGNSPRQTERMKLLRRNFIRMLTMNCGWHPIEFLADESSGVFLTAHIEELFQGYKLAQDEWLHGAVDLRNEIQEWLKKEGFHGNLDRAWKERVILLNLDVKDLGW